MRRAVAVTLVDQVSAAIRRAILTGELQPGETLRLRDLAERLGVSTLPVREAVWRLTGQGLLIPAAGRRGARVRPLDAADLHGIYRLRMMVEPELASRSCLLLAEAELDALAEMVRTSTWLDPDLVYQTRHELHLRLLGPAATDWDLRMLEDLWLAAGRYIRAALGCPVDEVGSGYGAYLDLIAAFRTRDPGVVAAGVRSHLESLEASARHAASLGAAVSGCPRNGIRSAHRTGRSTAAFAATSRHSPPASEE